MQLKQDYHRPQSLAEALALLQRSDVRTAPLAGGSWLVPHLRLDVPGSIADDVDAVVDLADLGLSYVERSEQPDGAWLRLGATTTLAQVAENAECQQLAGGLLAQAAHDEAPLNLRNTATIGGGIVKARSESELLLALLALAARAVVVIGDGQERSVPLPDLLADPETAIGRGLIAEVQVPLPPVAVHGGLARVARTPSDQPIVAAAAVVDDSGARVAIGGVIAVPRLIRLAAGQELEAEMEAVLAGADLLTDFRGSAGYRRAMAPIIAQRALAQAQGA